MSATLATTEQPTARKRRRKPRTKAVSPLPAIVASDLPHAEIDLTPGREHLVCPDCKRWTPITGVLGTPKLVPHHTERAKSRTETLRRCSGTNRKVVIDIAIEDWHSERTQAVAIAEATAATRRATKVLPKKSAVVPTPVQRLASMPAPSSRLLAAQAMARTAVNEHRAKCKVCRTGQTRCPDGRELEIRMGHTDGSVRLAIEQHESALRAAAAPSIPRTQQWRRVDSRVSRVDTRRHALPAEITPLTDFRGPDVPLLPQDPDAHDRRQAELGMNHARKAAAPSA
ncbi:hypothetical protein OHB41_50745 [Streptomyces sp. NBC_01571]|uniref:hypothetical protein n=1 Tax=Streptomyces sp. NBC_01571 TaxID=2975883 RepID=UPI0022578504|nr:hypothetical protein [Streptomyces sp. NBC_01571]MCX4581239.1 hypothetical protein [Streptomyces sp. NBC_01571]